VTPTVAAFSYLVPTLPSASVTFTAAEGCLNTLSTGCGLVHRDGLVGGGAALAVTIPAPAKSLTITPAGPVSATSQFSFASGSGGDIPYVSVFANRQSQNDRLYVISRRHSFALPRVLNGGFTLLAGESYGWQIETHGSPASVDEMAGPTGYMDAFSTAPSDLKPKGSRPGNGSYTLSVQKTLTVAN